MSYLVSFAICLGNMDESYHEPYSIEIGGVRWGSHRIIWQHFNVYELVFTQSLHSIPSQNLYLLNTKLYASKLNPLEQDNTNRYPSLGILIVLQVI